MRVGLIIPPSGFLIDERVFPSLGVLKVAAALEAGGHTVSLLDLSGRAGIEAATAAWLQDERLDAVGITTTMPQMPAAAVIAATVRRARPDLRLILGGPHPTLLRASARQEIARGQAGRATAALAALHQRFDVLVAGDGERAVFEALRPGPPALVDVDDPASPGFLQPDDLDAAPLPARHLIDMTSYQYQIDGHPTASLIGQLGCPFGCAFSVTGDTIVFTDEGPVEIQALSSGVGAVRACVHGPSMLEYRIDRWVAGPSGRARATRAVAEGVRPVLHIATEGGHVVKSTGEHRWLCAVDERLTWKRADEIRPGDFLVMRRPDRDWPDEYPRLIPPTLPVVPPGGFERRPHHRMPAVLDESLAWLVGFIIGDGCLPSDGRPEFHVAVTPEVEARLRETVQTYFGVPLRIFRSRATSKMQHGWVRSRLAREILIQSIGVDPDDKLKIPAIFWRAPRTVLAAFLDGLYAADAYSPAQGSPALTTISRRLAYEVAYALLMLDRGCPVVHAYRNYGYVTGQGQYRVSLLDNDRIPSPRALYHSRKSGRWYWRTPRRPGLLGIRRRTLRESGLHHPLDRSGHYYVRVAAVTPDLAEPVYDLTVPEGEAFVANGFVAHNCGGRRSPFLRRVRLRSPEHVVAEMRHLYEVYGATGFMFLDDELNVNRALPELLRGIIALRDELGVELRLRGLVKSQLVTDEQAALMAEAGMSQLLVGFESGSERILATINKRATVAENTRCVEILRRHGIRVKALMSIGHAGETPETIRATRDWLLAVEPEDFDVTIITVYPGTPYYDDAIETAPGVWTYTDRATGDRLHAHEVDQFRDVNFYKGQPGAYQSFVWTDALSVLDLTTLRDDVEAAVRARLGIPYPTSAAAVQYEHSMGLR